MNKRRSRATGLLSARRFAPIHPVDTSPPPVRLLRWLTAPEHGQVRSTLPFAVATGLAIVATYGQALAYPHEDTTPEFAFGAYLILAMNALLGFAVALTFNPLPMVMKTADSEAQLGASGAGMRVWPMFGLLIALQVVIGIPVAIACSIGEWTWVFSPLLFGAVLPLIAMLLSWLVALMVLWPIITLLGAVWKLITRRSVDGTGTAFSILLLTVSALAVVGMLGTDPEAIGDQGGSRGAGLVYLIRTWTDQTGDPTTLAFRWAARALMVVLVVEIVAMGVAGDRSRRAARGARAASHKSPLPKG